MKTDRKRVSPRGGKKRNDNNDDNENNENNDPSLKTPFLSARLKPSLPEGLRPPRLTIRSGPKSFPLTTHPECGLCQSQNTNDNKKTTQEVN